MLCGDLKGKEINRMVNTRDLFKKMRGTRNISSKDGNSKGQKPDGPKSSRRY